MQQQFGEDLERPLSPSCRWHLGLRVPVPGGYREQPRKGRCRIFQSDAPARGELLQQIQLVCRRHALLEPHASLEHLGDRVQRAVHLIGRTLGLEDLVELFPDGFLRCAEQARLPDTGLAAQEQRLAVPGHGFLPGGPNQLDFAFASDERRQPRRLRHRLEAAGRAAPSKDAEDLHRSGEASQRSGAEILDSELAADQLPRFIADGECVRAGFRLNARRDVRRLAQCELFAAHARADIADHDETGMNADADVRSFPAGTNALDPLQQVESRMHGARGIVFVRHWISEVRQHAVTQVLRDVTLVVTDDLGACRLILRVELAQFFGVEAFGQRRGADNVGEEDGEMTPLCVRCPCRVQRASATSAGRCTAWVTERTGWARHAHRGSALGAELDRRGILSSAIGTLHPPLLRVRRMPQRRRSW